MGDRVVDCARLESVCTERYRGFESRPIRQFTRIAPGIRNFLDGVPLTSGARFEATEVINALIRCCPPNCACLI
jgi:hypothetical protein